MILLVFVFCVRCCETITAALSLISKEGARFRISSPRDNKEALSEGIRHFETPQAGKIRALLPGIDGTRTKAGDGEVSWVRFAHPRDLAIARFCFNMLKL